MSFIGLVGAQLKADNSDFRAKMQEAGEATEGLDKRLKKFGLGFGGVAALATAFRAVLDHARDLTGELDANEAAAKRFAGGVDSAKKSMLDLGVQAMGYVNSLGEWWGRMAAVNKQGEAQVALQEQIEAQAEQTLRNIESQKKMGAELGAIRTRIRETEEKISSEGVKQLGLDEQILIAKQKVAAAGDDIARAGADQREAAKAELAQAQARLELQKLEGDQAKQVAEAKKKADDEAAKAAAKEKDAEVDAHIAKMDAIEREKAAKVAAAAAAREAEQASLGTMEQQLAALQSQNVSEAQIVATLRGRGFEEEDILKKINKQTEAIQFQTTVKSKGRGDTDLSDRALEDKIRNLSAGIAEIDRDVIGSRYNSSTRAQMQKELTFARDELGDRGRIRQQVGQFGEEGAARFYAGQIDQFERLLKFVNPQDSQQRTANGIEELNERLAGLGATKRRR